VKVQKLKGRSRKQEQSRGSKFGEKNKKMKRKDLKVKGEILTFHDLSFRNLVVVALSVRERARVRLLRVRSGRASQKVVSESESAE